MSTRWPSLPAFDGHNCPRAAGGRKIGGPGRRGLRRQGQEADQDLRAGEELRQPLGPGEAGNARDRLRAPGPAGHVEAQRRQHPRRVGPPARPAPSRRPAVPAPAPPPAAATGPAPAGRDSPPRAGAPPGPASRHSRSCPRSAPGSTSRASGTPPGRVGSASSASTPAPSERIAFRFGSAASRPGGRFPDQRIVDPGRIADIRVDPDLGLRQFRHQRRHPVGGIVGRGGEQDLHARNRPRDGAAGKGWRGSRGCNTPGGRAEDGAWGSPRRGLLRRGCSSGSRASDPMVAVSMGSSAGFPVRPRRRAGRGSAPGRPAGTATGRRRSSTWVAMSSRQRSTRSSIAVVPSLSPKAAIITYSQSSVTSSASGRRSARS